MKIPKWVWLAAIAVTVFWVVKAAKDGPAMTSAVMSDPGMGTKKDFLSSSSKGGSAGMSRQY